MNDDDTETNRQERIFWQLRETMRDQKIRTRIFNHLCGVPIAANQVEMMIEIINQYLNPKGQKPKP